MPIRREEYSPDWDEISLAIRQVQAGGCCEQCGVRNHAVIRRLGHDQFRYATGCELLQLEVLTNRQTHAWRLWRALQYLGLSKIGLTVAHLDRDRTNNASTNLRALCQRCHLVYDVAQHVRNRKYGRYHDREHQLKLPW